MFLRWTRRGARSIDLEATRLNSESEPALFGPFTRGLMAKPAWRQPGREPTLLSQLDYLIKPRHVLHQNHRHASVDLGDELVGLAGNDSVAGSFQPRGRGGVPE
jgi:hypothetical protein